MVAIIAGRIPTPNGSTFHGFLTHTWRRDELGRPNHERVSWVFEALIANELENWFDGERVQGGVEQEMVEGVDDSVLPYDVVVFVTKEYIENIASGNEKDNCFIEFSNAGRKKPDEKKMSAGSTV